MTNDEILTKFAGSVRTRLRHHISRMRKIQADYQAEVDDWYANGPGQSPHWVDEWDEDLQDVIRYNAGGNGYTFPHCIHGSSRWTDYDNICGGCEDGYLTGGSVAKYALEQAQGDVLTFHRRTEWLRTAPSDLPKEIRDFILDWAVESIV